jgi:hypothetical protein
MANVFKAIGGFFKKVFGWVFRNTDVDEFFKKEFYTVVIPIVAQMSLRDITNAEKREFAVREILSALATVGKAVAEHVVRLAVEIAVAQAKGTIG